MEELATDLMAENDTVINLYLAISLGPWAAISPDTFLPILAQLSQTYPGNAVFQEAIVSSLNGSEENFQKFINKPTANKNTSQLLDTLLSQTIKNKQEGKMNSIFVQRKIPLMGVQHGLVIYRSVCSACHGPDEGSSTWHLR